MDESIHDLTAAYAVDALDGGERALYETHLATCESCRDELEGFWRVSGSLAHAAAGPAPPPALRSRILAEARRDRPNVVPFRQRLALPAAASFAAVAAVAAIGLGLWGTSLSRELDDVRTQLSGNTEAVVVLSDPQAQQVTLSGAEGQLVVADSGRAALVVAGLPQAPEGKTYQIWVISEESTTPAGLFEVAHARTVLPVGHPVPDDAIVAVTLERDGGVEAPTAAPLVESATV